MCAVAGNSHWRYCSLWNTFGVFHFVVPTNHKFFTTKIYRCTVCIYWLKASLPCSRGGLNLHWSALHAPAAYVNSVVETLPLVSEITLSDSLPSTCSLNSAFFSLAEATHRSDWVSMESIESDVSIHQCSLS